MKTLTAVAAMAARDFRRLNGGHGLTAPDAEQLVAHIVFRTTAGRAGAFNGQSIPDAIAAALAA